MDVDYGLAGDYTPPAVASAGADESRGAGAGVLRVLPNLDVVAVGQVTAPERLVLGAFAEQTGDRVWTVSAASLLGALDASRSLEELTVLLRQRSDDDLPGALSTLVADVTARAGRLSDLGTLRVVECADAATAALIASDRTLRRLVRPLGDRFLAMAPEREGDVRRALVRIGYVRPRRTAR